MSFQVVLQALLKKTYDKVLLLAPSSTALTNATWTDAKAAFLDQTISTAGKTFKTEKFTSSGTWTRPTGVDAIHVLMVGGGGGGAGAYTSDNGKTDSNVLPTMVEGRTYDSDNGADLHLSWLDTVAPM